MTRADDRCEARDYSSRVCEKGTKGCLVRHRESSGERADAIPEAVRHLSFFVPPGFLLMKQSEVDRIHNESEALRIERDAARAALAAAPLLPGGDPLPTLTAAQGKQLAELHAEVERLRSLLPGGGEAERLREAAQTVLNARHGTFAQINRALDGLDSTLRGFAHPDAERAPQGCTCWYSARPCPACRSRPEQPSPDSLGARPPSEPENGEER